MENSNLIFLGFYFSFTDLNLSIACSILILFGALLRRVIIPDQMLTPVSSLVCVRQEIWSTPDVFLSFTGGQPEVSTKKVDGLYLQKQEAVVCSAAAWDIPRRILVLLCSGSS